MPSASVRSWARLPHSTGLHLVPSGQRACLRPCVHPLEVVSRLKTRIRISLMGGEPGMQESGSNPPCYSSTWTGGVGDPKPTPIVWALPPPQGCSPPTSPGGQRTGVSPPAREGGRREARPGTQPLCTPTPGGPGHLPPPVPHNVPSPSSWSPGPSQPGPAQEPPLFALPGICSLLPGSISFVRTQPAPERLGVLVPLALADRPLLLPPGLAPLTPPPACPEWSQPPPPGSVWESSDPGVCSQGPERLALRSRGQREGVRL